VQAASVSFAGGVEAPRSEWFLAGSEPVGSAVSSSVRIVAPVDGTIVAWDPEVPAQRVGFVASSHDPSLRWVVDGRVVGSARAPWLWEPVVGRHAVALVDASGRARDTVRFVVRGGARSGVDRSGASRY
jgi:penicillin-binding protein 1C